MKLFQKLVCMALTATATASLSICAFAADYTFDTAADTDYYPSTSYEDTYGTAYHYGSKNLVDYQIPELPYGVLSTTQTGVMEKLRLPGLQQTVGGSASGVYGVDSGVGIPAVTPVISSYQEPAYHAYLYITGYGYTTTVGTCWLAPLVEAGEGINLSFLVKRQPKEKILSKIAQTTMVNRSRMRDVGDTRQDY